MLKTCTIEAVAPPWFAPVQQQLDNIQQQLNNIVQQLNQIVTKGSRVCPIPMSLDPLLSLDSLHATPRHSMLQMEMGHPLHLKLSFLWMDQIQQHLLFVHFA